VGVAMVAGFEGVVALPVEEPEEVMDADPVAVP
jgi:hypothetical protein